ncbi:MAG TPA: iron-containing alcohol dehydrogenase [Clostridiaceae bacterium]|nr:iron-containing alcohol dehydrogenase [Clostridiaceae bacterium]
MAPAWSFTLPPLQTACGAFDAISHCMECYFTDTEDADYLGDWRKRRSSRS